MPEIPPSELWYKRLVTDFPQWIQGNTVSSHGDQAGIHRDLGRQCQNINTFPLSRNRGNHMQKNIFHVHSWKTMTLFSSEEINP